METYVINLDRRMDRAIYIDYHLSSLDIPYKRFPAIEGGWRGCRDSHLAILSSCDDNAVMILEDDVQFLGDIYKELPKAFEQLPENWDCLFLGASPQEPQQRYSDNLFRISNSYTTHAIIWQLRENGAVEYMLNNKEKIGKIDVFIAQEIMPTFNCFLIFPMLATQIQTQSDTCSRSDVSTIIANYNKYCK